MKYPKKLTKFLLPGVILLIFASCYLILSLIKHNHFMSGYDLAIIDQAIWKYANFKNPITTSHVFFDTTIYSDHLEIVFLLIAPFYRIFDTVNFLIVLQVAAIISSGVAVYMIAQFHKLNKFISLCILTSYLSFFGIQFSIWSDVHSLLFALTFMSWFIYFLTIEKNRPALLFLVLSVISKEDVAFLTLLIALVFYLSKRTRASLISVILSGIYLAFIFFVYFPNIGPDGYRFFQNENPLSELNPLYLVNTLDKQKTFLYSFGWFGFVPLLSLLYTFPFFGDIAHYFVAGNGLTRTEGIFLHYRSTTALFMVWPTIIAIKKLKFLNKWYFGLYLLISAGFFQYYLHLPLSYLSKSWFWKEEVEVSNIKSVLRQIPKDSSIVTQNNIAPHLSHRDYIYTLFPSQKDFSNNSPCQSLSCNWFRVGGKPKLLLIDKGSSWNIIQLLGSREDFYKGVENLEKNGNIKLLKKNGTTYLYKIVKNI